MPSSSTRGPAAEPMPRGRDDRGSHRAPYAGPRPDLFLKIGGSLVDDLPATRRLMDVVSGLRHLRVVVTTGGGREAKRIKRSQPVDGLDFEICRTVGFSLVDVRAMLLTAFSPRSVLVHTLRQVERALSERRLLVLAPGRLIRRFDLFEHDWDLTTDSVGLYFAWVLGASWYVIVTDVDGIFDRDPGASAAARLLPAVCADELRALGGGKVDRYFAEYLSRYPVRCTIVNGRFPERLCGLLDQQPVRATTVTAAEGRSA